MDSSADLEYGVADKIDGIAIEFEKQWPNQRLEDVVTAHPDVSADDLTLELIAVSLELDDSVSVHDFARQFPHLKNEIHRLSRSGDDLATSPTIAISSEETGATPVGQYIGQFRILDTIAVGGMGVVYRAQQQSPNRTVALKTIRGGSSAQDDAVLRFKVEAQAVANLQHPNIVPVYEFGYADGMHYLVMPYIVGQNVSDAIGDTPMNARAAAELMLKIVNGVEHAHSRSVTHRDLKPGNVLLDESGEPLITDFGLASHREDSALTATNQILGTPSYMSPEQAGGRSREAGPLADIYSLGAMLYFLLTAKPPYKGATPVETMQLVLQGELVSPTRLVSSVPRDLETICRKCLDGEPSRRYSSASELSADLRSFLAGEPIKARPISAPMRLLRWCRRRPWQTGAAVLAALLLVGIPYAAYRIEQAQIDADRAFVAEYQATLSDAMLTQQRLGRAEAALRGNDLNTVNGLLLRVDDFCGRILREEARRAPTRILETSRSLVGHFSVICAARSDDGRSFVFGDQSGQLLLRNVDDGSERVLIPGYRNRKKRRPGTWLDNEALPADKRESKPFCVGVAWSGPDRILIAELSGKLQLVDLSDQTVRFELLADLGERLNVMCLDAARKRIAVGTDQGDVVTCDPDGQNMRRTSKGLGRVTAIKSVRAEVSQPEWLVGTEDGRVAILNSDLVPVAETMVSGSVWDFAIDDSDRIAVGVTGGGPVLLSRSGTDLRRLQQLELPEYGGQDSHAVAFTPDGKSLISAGTNYRAVVWDLELSSIQACSSVARLDKRIGLQNYNVIPHSLQRTSGGLWVDANDRFCTVGNLGVFSDWKLEQRVVEDDLRKKSSQSVGSRPDIVFSHDGAALWALAADGTLRLLSSDRFEVLDEVQAHSPHSVDSRTSRTGQIRLMGDGLIATVARDYRVRFWKQQDNQIVAQDVGEFESEVPILAFAASATHVAAVNARSRLIVWDRSSGEQLLNEPVRGSESDKCPLVGAVEFNMDATLLAATGSDQECHIYDLATLSPIDHRLNVTGAGTLDLAWSPVSRTAIRLADTREGTWVEELDPRIPRTGSRRTTARLMDLIVDVDSLPSESGTMALFRSGTIRFYSGRHGVELGRVKFPCVGWAAAMDPKSRQLVVATPSGYLHSLAVPCELDRKETVSHPALSFKKSLHLEKNIQLASSTPVRASFGDDGTLRFLVVGSSGDNSQLILFELRGGKWTKKTVTESWEKFDSMAPTTAMVTRGSEVFIVYRRKRPDLGQYDSDLVLSHRDANGKWTREEVSRRINDGELPIPYLNGEGKLTAIGHFRLDGYAYVVSANQTRTADGWPIVAEQSLKRFMEPVRVGDKIHTIERCFRLGYMDPAPSVYAVWDGYDGVERFPLPEGSAFGTLLPDPQGHPVARVEWLDPERPTGWYQRTADGWKKYSEDFGEPRSSEYVILPNGIPARFRDRLRFETAQRIHEFQVPPGPYAVNCHQDRGTGRIVITQIPHDGDGWLKYAELTASDFEQ